MAFKLAQASSRMPKMAIRHFCIAPPSRITNFVHTQNASEETAGYLASISSRSRVDAFQTREEMVERGRNERQPYHRVAAS
jgi:hypothetical protein